MSKLLKLFFITISLSAICWIILIPLWQYPDEQAHFAQVQNIAESGKSPASGNNTSSEIVQSEKILKTERNENGNNSYTYHPEFNIEYSNSYFGIKELYLANIDKSQRKQLIKSEATSNPPLYYYMSAIFYRIFYNGSLLDRAYAIRLSSLSYYLLTIFICYKIGKLTLKNNLLAIFFASFIAFMPMIIFSSTGILPDSLTNLLFTLMIFFSVRILIKLEKRIFIFALITLILGAQTRQHFLLSIPIFLLAVSYQFYKIKKLHLVFILTSISLILLVLIEKFATTIPIIGNFRISDISNLKPELLISPVFINHIIWSFKHTYAEVLPWYWGVYRWLSLTLPHIANQIINRLLLISLIGFSIYFINIIRSKKINSENKIAIFMLTSIFIYFFSLLIWDYFFRLKNNFSFGFQGRYYFPLISAEFVIILIGFREIARVIFKKNIQYLLFLLTVLMIIFSDFSLYFVASSYYNVANLNNFIVQASQYKPIIIKGDVLFLILALTLAFQLLFIFYLAKSVASQALDKAKTRLPARQGKHTFG